MRKRTSKRDGLVDWSTDTKYYLAQSIYSFSVYCIIKDALEECGLEKTPDGSSYKMGEVIIDFDPTWAYITLKAPGLDDYVISYLEPSLIAENFFKEIRAYWRKYENLNRNK